MDTYISPVVLPYSGNIPGGLRPDLEIEIEGTIPQQSNGFGVNLCQGPQLEPNTLLHLNVRFKENCAVLNSMQNKVWGGEERKPIHQAFEKGKQFELRIKVESQGFKVKVNGHHFADFNHRLPKEMGQFLVVSGELTVNFIKYHLDGHYQDNPTAYASTAPYSAQGSMYPGGGYNVQQQPSAYPIPSPQTQPGYNPGGFNTPQQPSAYPTPSPQAQPGYNPGGFNMPQQPSTLPAQGQPIFNPPVPFKTEIPGALAPGRMISISGIPNPSAARFTINLQNGLHDGCDVIMHFDVRFHFGSNVNVVVRNHCQRGGWGPEENQLSHFPFVSNSNFDLLILVEQNCFKIAVNGQHLLEFKHRLPYQEANSLSINGDVKLTQIRFQ